jgi:hypothetical protein
MIVNQIVTSDGIHTLNAIISLRNWFFIFSSLMIETSYSGKPPRLRCDRRDRHFQLPKIRLRLRCRASREQRIEPAKLVVEFHSPFSSWAENISTRNRRSGFASTFLFELTALQHSYDGIVISRASSGWQASSQKPCRYVDSRKTVFVKNTKCGELLTSRTQRPVTLEEKMDALTYGNRCEEPRSKPLASAMVREVERGPAMTSPSSRTRSASAVLTSREKKTGE